MSVKVFKLVTGEELIGEIVSYDSGVYVVKQPLGIGINQQEQRLVFVPYMPYTEAEEEITLFESALIMAPLEPVPQIVEDYNRVTNPPLIELPPQRSLIRPV